MSTPRFLLLFILMIFGINYATISINSVNSSTIKLYEKFEATYDLTGFSYDNPYNPEEIDVTVLFTSPSGKEWRVFGFYDDYENASEWKLRFSPNEIGEWTYVISAQDAATSDQSDKQTFTATDSDLHGWITLSEDNRRYMEYEDGTSYFGVGMYTPWQNTVAKFDLLQEFGGNMFAVWNITYGGMTNGYGLIEEELGRYNQTKCGKIDEMLQVAEERGMNVMYCFWPHDLFSNTVWAHQWHQNPYRLICDVEDVYSDAECWEYQKKQYRYLIARFAHSRALGIWEIMNEINGTDGWAAGRHDEALNWVKKVHDYFKANDPYQHLTTASRSGGFGEYWPEMYQVVDLPNIHVYETQGWNEEYAGNTLRSSMYNYAWAAARFWNSFDKPGIFGEAGADWVRVDVKSPEYEALYHNAIWATLTNGLAAIPYWWTFTNPIRDEEREHMLHLSKFVADIDFVKESREHFEATTKLYDLFGMKNDSTAFGWIRQVNGGDVSKMQFDLNGVLNPGITVYAISYFNPWTGEQLETHIRPHVDHKLRDTMPSLKNAVPDVAFKIGPAKGGDTPARLDLSTDTSLTLNIDTLAVPVTCYLFDAENRFCPNSSASISFAVEGSGRVDQSDVSAENGSVTIQFHPGTEPGMAKIIATSAGLISDTVSVRIRDKMILDDFESYNSNSELQNSWINTSGYAEVSLDTEFGDGQSLKLDYGVGGDFNYTAIVEKEIDQNYNGGNFLTFWLQGDASKHDMEIRLYDQDRQYWRYTFALDSDTPGVKAIPLGEFSNIRNLDLDLSSLSKIRLTIRTGQGDDGAGVLYFDDIKFSETAPSAVTNNQDGTKPARFELTQNFPNPFNLSTNISYTIPVQSRVQLSVYNLKGQLVQKLVDDLMEAGSYTETWNASEHLSSGVYFYQLEAGQFAMVKKSLLTK